MATLKRKAHVVHATAPSDLVATVLASSHFRMLMTVTLVTITLWFCWSTLYTKCDMEDESVLTSLGKETLFKKNPAAGYVGQSIHWLECLNTTNNYKTKITFDQNYVQVDWTEKDEYRCIREDAKIGRDTVHVAIILCASLVGVGFALQAIAFYRLKDRSKHAAISGAFAAIHALFVIAITVALWYVQNYAYYATIDEDKRDIKGANHWLWFVLVVPGIGAGAYAVLYGIAWKRTLDLYFGSKTYNDIDRTNTSGYVTENGDTNPKGTAPFKYRFVRTDTMISQYRHEKLAMAGILAIVAIFASAALRVHDETPGVRKFEIVHGDRLLDVTAGADADDLTAVALFTSNCTLYEPFVMNVTMHNSILSTKHHINHHIKDHEKGVIAVMTIFSIFALLEIATTAFTWVQQTFKLTHLFDAVTGTYDKARNAAEMPLMDIFFSWIPLVTQVAGSLGLSLMVVLVGYGTIFDEYKLRHSLLAASVVGTVTFLVHFFHFSIFVQHKLFHPTPKSDPAKKSP